jgi:hypothetical protein
MPAGHWPFKQAWLACGSPYCPRTAITYIPTFFIGNNLRKAIQFPYSRNNKDRERSTAPFFAAFTYQIT